MRDVLYIIYVNILNILICIKLNYNFNTKLIFKQICAIIFILNYILL